MRIPYNSKVHPGYARYIVKRFYEGNSEHCEIMNLRHFFETSPKGSLPPDLEEERIAFMAITTPVPETAMPADTVIRLKDFLHEQAIISRRKNHHLIWKLSGAIAAAAAVLTGLIVLQPQNNNQHLAEIVTTPPVSIAIAAPPVEADTASTVVPSPQALKLPVKPPHHRKNKNRPRPVLAKANQTLPPEETTPAYNNCRVVTDPREAEAILTLFLNKMDAHMDAAVAASEIFD